MNVNETTTLSFTGARIRWMPNLHVAPTSWTANDAQARAVLPEWAKEDIRHLLREVMVTELPEGEPAATAAEWKHIYDTLSKMLDPDYDDGWRTAS